MIVYNECKATTIFLPFDPRADVMVKWSKFVDHNHGQSLKITIHSQMVKILTMIMSKIQIFHGQDGQP